jgi:hypothetical protein
LAGSRRGALFCFSVALHASGKSTRRLDRLRFTVQFAVAASAATMAAARL